jgi:hypothetical protein
MSHETEAHGRLSAAPTDVPTLAGGEPLPVDFGDAEPLALPNWEDTVEEVRVEEPPPAAASRFAPGLVAQSPEACDYLACCGLGQASDGPAIFDFWQMAGVDRSIKQANAVRLVLPRIAPGGGPGTPVVTTLAVQAGLGGFVPADPTGEPAVTTEDAWIPGSLLMNPAAQHPERLRSATSVTITTSVLDFLVRSVAEHWNAVNAVRAEGDQPPDRDAVLRVMRPVIGTLDDVHRDPRHLFGLVRPDQHVYIRPHNSRSGRRLAQLLHHQAPVRLLHPRDGEPESEMERWRDGWLWPTDYWGGYHPARGTRPFTGGSTGITRRPLSAAAQLAGARWREKAAGKRTPIRAPWPELTERLGGGFDTGATVIAGGTGSWKTDIGAAVVYRAIRQLRPVLVINTEMGNAAYMARVTSKRDSRMSWSATERGELSAQEVARFADRAKEFFSTALGDIWDIQPYRVSPGDLVADIEEWRHLCKEQFGDPKGPPLVVVDYIQSFGAGAVDERARMSEAVYGLNELARTTDTVFVILSSVARDKYERLWSTIGDGDPQDPVNRAASEFVGIGKGAGELEYGAMNVIVLSPVRDESGRRVELALGIAKARFGEPTYAGDWVRFKVTPFGLVSKDQGPEYSR